MLSIFRTPKFEVHTLAGPKIYQTVLKLAETYSKHNMKTFILSCCTTNKCMVHSKTELQINYENQWEITCEEPTNYPSERHNL